jgi:ribonuclease R
MLPLPERLTAMFKEHRGELFKTNEISKMIGIKSDHPEYQELRDTLNELESRGQIVRGSRRRYGIPPPEVSTLEGTLRMQSSGNAIVTPDAHQEFGDTVLIRGKHLQRAQDGDRVRINVAEIKKGERAHGEVIRVLEHSTRPVIGREDRTHEERAVERIIVDRRRGAKGEEPERKAKRIITLDEPRNEKPTQRTGSFKATPSPVTIESEMRAIAEEYGLPDEFPKAVLDELERIPTSISAEEIMERVDLRKKIIFTIDPEDAKDFDDAISLEENEDGTVTLGVHIADVSHYVQEGTALDEESLARGTSVYLVGGVIPMLPEKISNELCSLRPDEEKLTYSVFLNMDPESAEVLSSEIKKTIIKSVMRFTYEEAELRTTTGKGKYAALLKRMKKMSDRMYDRRHNEGSIDFETDEVRFVFDENGVPTESYKKVRLGSMRMIEDFMLAANRAIAEFIASKAEQGSERPFLYRIHADPDPGKLRDLAELAKGLGYKLSPENAQPKTIQKFLDSIKGKPEEKMLNQLMLRSMAKAVYAEHNVGHFGLAFSHYTHFTSPIRRYPDLIVHRLLFEYLSGSGMARTREHHYFQILPEIADQTSALERRATEAERESIKVAQMLLMKQHVGEEFNGTITGVTHFGIFIEVETGAEGLLHIRELPGFYTFDEAHHTLSRAHRGKGGKRNLRPWEKEKTNGADSYRIGDPIRVQLVKVLEEKRQMDFRLVEE